MKKRHVTLVVLFGLEGIALVLAYLAFIVSVGKAAVPLAEWFVRWMFALLGY